MKLSSKQKSDLLAVAKCVGEFIDYWGFRRIHGKIWTLVYLSEKPLSSLDLIKTLKVSKGLVSIALRELMQYELIFSVGKNQKGVACYQANPELLGVILKIFKQREQVMLAKSNAAIKKILGNYTRSGSQDSLSLKRLKELDQMIKQAQMFLGLLLKAHPKSGGTSDWIQCLLPPVR